MANLIKVPMEQFKDRYRIPKSRPSLLELAKLIFGDIDEREHYYSAITYKGIYLSLNKIGLQLSFDDLNYRSVYRTVMIKDGMIDHDKVKVKHAELLRLKEEDKKKKEHKKERDRLRNNFHKEVEDSVRANYQGSDISIAPYTPETVKVTITCDGFTIPALLELLRAQKDRKKS